MTTAIETTRTMLSKDGTKMSYLSMAADYAAFTCALAEHFTVYTIESRGQGLSSPQGDGYSIIKECEDVLVLQNKAGAPLLVGHSFGGLVALETACNNATLTKLAVYEPGVSIDDSIPMDWMPGYEKKFAEPTYNKGWYVPRFLLDCKQWKRKNLLLALSNNHGMYNEEGTRPFLTGV